jgi:tetratricopeptide (TPR) repeat protein
VLPQIRSFVSLPALLGLASLAGAQEPSAGTPTPAAIEAPDADEQGLGGVVGLGDSMPPARARFEIHLGWRSLQQGLSAQAAASFEKVTKDSPWHPGAWYLLSRARFAQDRVGDALTAAERAVASHRALKPARRAAFDPALFQYQLGLCLNAAGRPEESASALREAVRLRPGSARFLGQLGDTLLELGRDAEAAATLQRAVDAEPTLGIAWLASGRALTRLDRHDEAKAALERAIELLPDSSDAWYALASLHRASGDFDAQEAALVRFEELREPAEAARLARQEIDAQLRSAASALLDEDHETARPILDAVLAHEHVVATGFRRGRVLSDLARCETLAGNVDEAIALYRRALEVNPRSFTANFELGTVLAGAGRVERALPLLLDAAAINPFDYSVHANLALTFGFLGRLNDAVGEIRRAAALQPEDLRVRQLLVDFEWAVGNQAQATALVARLGGVELPGQGEPLRGGAEWAR